MTRHYRRKNNKTKKILRGGTNIVGSLMALGKGVTEKVIQKSINSVGDLVNVDTNKTPTQVIDEIKSQINNPETQKSLRNVGIITAAAVEAAKPGLDKMIDTGAVMAEKIGKKAILIGRGLIAEVPIIGPLLELPILVSDVVKAAEEVTEQSAKMLVNGTETIANIKKAIDDTKNRLDTEINNLTNDVNGFQNNMEDYQKQSDNIVNRANNSISDFKSNVNNNNLNKQFGGKKTRSRRVKRGKTIKNLYLY